MLANKKRKLFVVFFTAILIVVCAISVGVVLSEKKERETSMEKVGKESNTKHMVSPNGAYIWAYDSIPVEIIDFVKEYIKSNGYDNSDIVFIFKNSLSTHYSSDYPSKSNDEQFTYYIENIYKNTIVGYMLIDEEANIIEVNNFIPISELSKIPMELDIGSTESIIRAREHLGLGSDVLIEQNLRVIYTVPSNGELIFGYKIRFKGRDDYIYINGITGEIIE